jgi:hypothetical protein
MTTTASKMERGPAILQRGGWEERRMRGGWEGGGLETLSLTLIFAPLWRTSLTWFKFPVMAASRSSIAISNKK